MTNTEKKYNQHIGKLYWSANRVWDSDKEEYKPIYDLVMPVNLRRRYGHGRYLLTLRVLQFSQGKSHGQEEYDIEASFFVLLMDKINHWHQGYFPAKTGDLKKDVDQIKKAS
jgi:hypothetical protein